MEALATKAALAEERAQNPATITTTASSALVSMKARLEAEEKAIAELKARVEAEGQIAREEVET